MSEDLGVRIGDRFKSEAEGAAYLRKVLPLMRRSEIRMAYQFDYVHPYQRRIIAAYVREQGWTPDDPDRDDRNVWQPK